MRKCMLSVLATVAFAAGGAVWAQDGGPDCQAGSAYGTPPGCGGGPSGAPAYGNSGFTPPPNPYEYGRRGQYSPDPAYPYDRADRERRAREDAQRRDREARAYATRRDRDGDGVSNRRDRFPDDPRRH
ncbi:MAG TPA: hypothetical protein VLI46_04085 [Ramlibacter sp.]|nr:hypothetical protein [Ramlibacter sp.]